MNTSATGGYLQPAPLAPFPGNLNFRQFIQTVLVGISGLPASLVRPIWQQSPPKQPDINVDWMSYGITQNHPDANGYNWIDNFGVTHSQRHADVKIQCQFYGPNGMEYTDLVRDNFQIPQNLALLTSVDLGFVATGDALQVPDLVNERWVDRWIMEVYLRREIERVYPILSFVQAQGAVETVLQNQTVTIPFKAPENL